MIVLDIDGVTANMLTEVDYKLRKLGYDVRDINDLDDYHWKGMYPNVPTDVLHDICVDPLTVKNAKAIESSWYWINHMSSVHDIMFLTARDPSLSEHTWAWFFDWDLPADFVVFEKNKVEFLTTIAESVYIYVDDYPDMVEQAHDAGIHSYLFNQPYNRNADIPSELRIDSLWEASLRI